MAHGSKRAIRSIIVSPSLVVFFAARVPSRGLSRRVAAAQHHVPSASMIHAGRFEERLFARLIQRDRALQMFGRGAVVALEQMQRADGVVGRCLRSDVAVRDRQRQRVVELRQRVFRSAGFIEKTAARFEDL